jgi:hypothetical protein
MMLPLSCILAALPDALSSIAVWAATGVIAIGAALAAATLAALLVGAGALLFQGPDRRGMEKAARAPSRRPTRESPLLNPR